MTEALASLALIAACGAGTYLWRGLGVALSGRINPERPLFVWVGCVAYAMVAGLVSRLILLPAGSLAAAPLEYRILACAAAVAGYYLGGRSLMTGVTAGVVALVALSARVL